MSARVFTILSVSARLTIWIWKRKHSRLAWKTQTPICTFAMKCLQFVYSWHICVLHLCTSLTLINKFCWAQNWLCILLKMNWISKYIFLLYTFKLYSVSTFSCHKCWKLTLKVPRGGCKRQFTFQPEIIKRLNITISAVCRCFYLENSFTISFFFSNTNCCDQDISFVLSGNKN